MRSITPTTDGQSLCPTGTAHALTREALSVWAKTSTKPGEWLSLAQHMADSRAVAARLFDEWLCRKVRERWEDSLGPHAKVLAEFLAGVHDVGKAAPAFVAQSDPLAQIARNAGLPCPPMEELRDDRKQLPHSLIGQHALREWLCAKKVANRTALGLASVVGAHHGKPVPPIQALEPDGRPVGMGGSPWRTIRFELLDWMAGATGFDTLLSDLSDATVPRLPLPLLVELSGFVVVADWLASNTRLFPLQQIGSQPDLFDESRVGWAWDEIGMPPPWEPISTDIDATTFFRARFSWREGQTPHPVQRAAFAAAKTRDVGLMFVETTTGGGKTETALAAAEVLAARFGAQGLMIALPTQATTDAMFTRIFEWLDALPQPPLDVGAWALMLDHGKARLNPKFAELVREFQEFEQLVPDTIEMSRMFDDYGGVPGQPCNAVVHQWFMGAKRRLLANFTVVTIDQLLMSALQRKHLMLAHVALSGKIVIIDEAHASDAYMNVYLDSALSWLGAYGVPVIVLSATLTEARRREMMRAYDGEKACEIDALKFDPHDYPLLTVLPRDGSPIDVQIIPDKAQQKDIVWCWHPTDLEQVVASVAAALQGQGCALVVRNTVKDAQATAAALAEAGIPVMLNHAGFTALDRSLRDAELRYLFGRDPNGRRPDLMAVVATQVVEQSLDVDFDVLFTDLAPMDLLLQRIGRLHRHANLRPAHLRTPRVHILADVSDGNPPEATKGSTYVYGAHLLLRTAATLNAGGTRIRLPEDVSPLVATALGTERIGPESWQSEMETAGEEQVKRIAAQRDKAERWCVKPWAGSKDTRTQLGKWLTTSSDYEEMAMGAAVRDTEPSLEVIVVPLTHDALSAVSPPWLQEMSEVTETIDTSTQPSDELARRIASWSVRLPATLTRRNIDRVIETIDKLPITKGWAWKRHPLLKGELLLPMALEEEGGTALATTLTVEDRSFRLRYSPDKGMEVFEHDIQPRR